MDFTGFFTHTMDGDYSNYCGPLNYVFDASIPIQNYLKYNGGTLITFEPLTIHAAGVFNHNLRVQLANYPSVFLDVPI